MERSEQQLSAQRKGAIDDANSIESTSVFLYERPRTSEPPTLQSVRKREYTDFAREWEYDLREFGLHYVAKQKSHH